MSHRLIIEVSAIYVTIILDFLNGQMTWAGEEASYAASLDVMAGGVDVLWMKMNNKSGAKIKNQPMWAVTHTTAAAAYWVISQFDKLFAKLCWTSSVSCSLQSLANKRSFELTQDPKHS